MEADINYGKDVADARIAEIKVETEAFRADMESGYNALVSGIGKSQGDFVEVLKEQIAKELETVEEACNFYTTLLNMMEAAGNDFKALDHSYIEPKVEIPNTTR